MRIDQLAGKKMHLKIIEACQVTHEAKQETIPSSPLSPLLIDSPIKKLFFYY